MIDLAKMRTQLKIHEGLELKPYVDTVGKLSIGVGRNLDDIGISEQEAMYLLDTDIGAALDGARAFHFWGELDSVRQMVVVDMVFNLGQTRFSRFTKTISFLHRGDYLSASIEMLQSKWARQVGVRATTLSKMMRTGDWPF